jgi:hypothetical protein
MIEVWMTDGKFTRTYECGSMLEAKDLARELRGETPADNGQASVRIYYRGRPAFAWRGNSETGKWTRVVA